MTIVVEGVVTAPPSEVWAFIGDFAHLERWHPRCPFVHGPRGRSSPSAAPSGRIGGRASRGNRSGGLPHDLFGDRMRSSGDGGGTTLQIARNVQAGRAGGYRRRPNGGSGSVGRQVFARPQKAAVDARKDPDTIIMARCDARDASTLEEACDRVAAYGEAGADLIVVPFLEIEEIPRITAATETALAHMFLPTDAKDADRERLEEIELLSGGYLVEQLVDDLLHARLQRGHPGGGKYFIDQCPIEAMPGRVVGHQRSPITPVPFLSAPTLRRAFRTSS